MSLWLAISASAGISLTVLRGNWEVRILALKLFYQNRYFNG
ncbi:hypothetical protein ACWAU0_13740 [Methylomonas sp. YC3]